MSSREPMWFCHECHAEMRPLMVPDPVCASCNGTFVEKIENPSDDPREFSHEGADLGDPGLPPGMGDLFMNIQSLMDRGMGPQRPSQPRPPGGAFTLEFRGPEGTRQIRLGGPNVLGTSRTGPPRGPPNMSSFLNPPPARDQQNPPGIQGALLAHYLMALLGHQDPSGAMLGAPGNGRMGDYVFNQEALDQIISQIMENSNSHRPVAAPEDLVSKLPREVLEEGSEMLQRDCAVCKDQFSLSTDNSDELVVITLPCKHPFHEPCILPWLKSSGTCPVCRFALVAQPAQPNAPPASGSAPPPPTSSPGPSGGGGGGGGGGQQTGGGGIFQSLFNTITGHSNNNTTNRGPHSGSATNTRSPTPSSQRQHRRSNSDPNSARRTENPRNIGNNPRTRGSRDGGNVPGGWEELD